MRTNNVDYKLDDIINGPCYTTDMTDNTCDVDSFKYSINDGMTVTTGIDVSKYSWSNIIDDNLTVTIDNSLTVGKYKLTEDTVEKLIGILDIFEDNKDLKDLLNTQIALNRIKNET